MKISYLEIFNFRNLRHVSINLGPQINLFYGLNGSGKTSLLEAIHYLGLGRSFRTRNINRLISQDTDKFSIFSQLTQEDTQLVLPVGIERKQDGKDYVIKIGGKVASSLVEIARALPLELLNADSHLLLSSGPLPRRQFLDWGVFHVEPSFYTYWQRANRLIKQRNAALKTAHSYHDVSAWDDELEQCALWLDSHRNNYQININPIFQGIIEYLLPTDKINLQYSAGWNQQRSLKQLLSESFTRDKRFGYTQHGPHRADLQIKVGNIPAAEILSQGQQKLTAYALRLAQGKLLREQTGKSCLFLIDDLPSELDKEKREQVASVLAKFDNQTIITGIDPTGFSNFILSSENRMFHVEHGSIERYC